MLLCSRRAALNRVDRRPVKKERSLTPSINLDGSTKALQYPETTGQGLAMPSNQEQPTEMSPSLGLLHLMIDLGRGDDLII
jgi:hypothetical protein